MKKIIISMLCMLLAVSSFAQMVGAGNISQSEQNITRKYSVKKHEFSIQVGFCSIDDVINFSGIMKYKFKPSSKYDIRLLGEVGIKMSDGTYKGDNISIFPILFGINYEGRLSKNWSIFTDFGLGVSVPFDFFEETRHIPTSYTYSYKQEFCDDFGLGFALSPEIGFIYKKFMFGIKYTLSLNECTYHYKINYYESTDDYLYYSGYFDLTLGFRF